MTVTRFFRAACLALVLAAVPGAARAFNLFDEFWGSTPLVDDQRLPLYSGVVPACDSAEALSKIQWRFQNRQAEYWHSDLQILGFDRVAEVRGLPHGSVSIPQRNCVAAAVMNDRQVRRVHYTILENGGLLGVTDGVEFCVSGLDRFARDCNGRAP
ncbi:MAG: hypothetical protein P4L76_04425 [Beijerinckiaceae bacterium]|nr:hypothetical protein [Beijerinckiaceae bacterium]